jgi:hypothetical protein
VRDAKRHAIALTPPFFGGNGLAMPERTRLLFSIVWKKRRSATERSGISDYGSMATATNVSSTRRTVRALRRVGALTDAHAAHATLALTTARALDDALDTNEKRYVIGQLARAHLLAVDALAALAEPSPPDAFDAFLAGLGRPGAGDNDTPHT